MFRALSTAQPWACLIVASHKDVENRQWTSSYRGQVLIHAPKKVDDSFFTKQGGFCLRNGIREQDYGYFNWRVLPQRQVEYPIGGIVGIANLVDVVTESESPWFVGKYGFVFEDARPLPFTPSRGQLQLYTVKDEFAEGILAREADGGVSDIEIMRELLGRRGGMLALESYTISTLYWLASYWTDHGKTEEIRMEASRLRQATQVFPLVY